MEPRRPGWQEYFMEFARLASRRSTCLRRQVGAVLVKEYNVLATGYNGSPRGLPHCAQTGCERIRLQVPSGQRHELCRGLHAEQNAIIQAAYHGTSIRDATLYCNTFPCVICAKMIINAGIREVVYEADYADELSLRMLGDAAVRLVRLSPAEAEAGEER